MGIDIGSSYTKITVIDEAFSILHQEVMSTLTRNKDLLSEATKKL